MSFRLGTQQSYAFACVVALLAATCILLPLRGQPLGVLPFFLPLHLFFITVTALATAALLLFRARIEASSSLAILAAAFVFAVPLAIGATLSLPQSIIWRGYAGADLESAVDCVAVARLGFAAGLCLFALATLPATRRLQSVTPFWVPSAWAFGLALTSLVAIFGANDVLPNLVAQGTLSPLHAALCIASVCLGAGAVVALALPRRSRSTIECWAAVAAVAAAIEALLAALVNPRYSLGWYAIRGFGTVAYVAVLWAIGMQASRVARALHERLSAEEALRMLAETIPQIVWTAQPTGVVDWANKRWFDYTGSSDAALADRWQGVVHFADLAQFKRRMLQMPSDASDFEVDLRLRGQDGLFRWFLTRVVPLRDPSGRIVRWYGTSTDVDEQRRQADRLRELFAREQRIAASLQTAFLPAHFPRSAGLAFSHVYLPAGADENVGGDWYDAFRVGEGRIAICVGDVSGHGIVAAVRMLRVRELLRAAAFDDPLPSVVLERAASAMGDDEPEHTVTALYGVFDTLLGEFAYACAGHPPPVFVRDGAARSLPVGGLPLGIEERPVYEDSRVAIRQGDVIALFTDGLIEAERDPVQGERLLHEALASGIIDAGALVSLLVPAQQLDDVAVATVAVGLLEPAALALRPWRFHAAEAARAAGARASFALYLRACGASPDELMRAEHAFGELLGNVVRHAPGPVDIEVTWHDRVPYLSVSDRGVRPFAVSGRHAPPTIAESGRGLVMLEELGLQPLATARAGGGTQMVVVLPCAALQIAEAGRHPA